MAHYDMEQYGKYAHEIGKHTTFLVEHEAWDLLTSEQLDYFQTVMQYYVTEGIWKDMGRLGPLPLSVPGALGAFLDFESLRSSSTDTDTWKFTYHTEFLHEWKDFCLAIKQDFSRGKARGTLTAEGKALLSGAKKIRFSLLHTCIRINVMMFLMGT